MIFYNIPMTYLFLFAHPDDETVACAGTIKRLTEAGHRVVVVSVTDGSAGQVSARAQADLAAAGSVGALRRAELAAACQQLGVHEWRILEYEDGHITNEAVWSELTQSCIEVIDAYRPDVVVTFDHTGWYFHLDHVAVSIATTLAVQQAAHQPDLFFHVHVMVNSARWRYVFADTAPITHVVDVSHLKDFKLDVINAHASQDITTIINYVQQGFRHYETYQLVRATPQGEALLMDANIFVPVSPEHEADIKRRTVESASS